MRLRWTALGFFAAVALTAAPPSTGRAEIALPPGFTVQIHVTGEGFDTDTARNARGIPSSASVIADGAGALYLARTGRRYSGGEFDYLWPVYRIPQGGARITPKSEGRFLYGPPLTNAQLGAWRGGRELFVSTFDRDRRIGVVFRLADGRAELFAGGTPDPGQRPLLIQPEGVAVDGQGNVYVADREQGLVMRLDPEGRVLDPRYVTISRPRLVVVDGRGGLWIGGDGSAEAPWQSGPGEIWHVSAQGEPRLVVHGPMAQGMSVSPDGDLFVADRRASQLFALSPDGTRVDLARFTEGDAPRGIAFAPVTPETRAAGIAGSLFVVVIRRSAWPVNEVIRISGPFSDHIRAGGR
jgi:NHL repeat